MADEDTAEWQPLLDIPEYDEMTPEERKLKRAELLDVIESRMREGDEGPPPKWEPGEENHPLSQPLYMATEVLDDDGYKGLSVAGKLTWYALTGAGNTIYHVGKPLDLQMLVLTAGFMTIFGRVLDGGEMSDGIHELVDAGLIGVYVRDDRVPKWERDESGERVVKDFRDEEREVVHFLKYVSFVKPEGYEEPEPA